MKLVSLEQKYSTELTSSPEGKSGYCPSIYLDAKMIEALGIGKARAGDEMKMVANVKVSNLSESDGGYRSITLEIEEAALAPKEAQKSASSIIYPDD